MKILIKLIMATIFTLLFGINEYCSIASEKPDFYRFYIGTYTGNKSKGIYSGKLYRAEDKIELTGLAAETVNPSFLTLHPNGKFLYAVNETSKMDGKNEGGVTAFEINPEDGKLKELNRKPSGGTAPCHLAIDKTGTFLVIANYGSGTVACYKLNENGTIGEKTAQIQHTGSGANPSRQSSPHAHWAGFSRDNKFAFVCDLGIDKVMIYQFNDQTGELKPNNPEYLKLPDGSGPRHLAFHPDGKRAFVINELNSTISMLSYNPDTGAFALSGNIKTLPQDFTGKNTTAEIDIHPNGKFLYGSNRGHDSIACFEIAPEKPILKLVDIILSGGKMPRNFAITPDGKYLISANQSTDNLVLFRINQDTGKLTPAGIQVEVGSPVCIIFIK